MSSRQHFSPYSPRARGRGGYGFSNFGPRTPGMMPPGHQQPHNYRPPMLSPRAVAQFHGLDPRNQRTPPTMPPIVQDFQTMPLPPRPLMQPSSPFPLPPLPLNAPSMNYNTNYPPGFIPPRLVFTHNLPSPITPPSLNRQDPYIASSTHPSGFIPPQPVYSHNLPSPTIPPSLKHQDPYVTSPRLAQPPPPVVVDPFVVDWMRIVGAGRPRQQPNSLKVPELRSLMCRVTVLLDQLKLFHQRLIALSPDDTSGWREGIQQVHRCKEELQSIRSKVDNGDTVEHLARKLSNLKARRERQKRQRREREMERKRKSRQAEEATEKWLKKKREEELKTKTEKSVHLAASGLLGEVKKKQSDTQYYKNLAGVLRELRDLRREASKKKGDAPPIEADEQFTNTCDSLVQLLTNQMRVYEEEEHALRVLMEEEVAEKMATSASRSTRSSGQETGTVDPLQPFREFYLQAERRVDALVGIRGEWDKYLSPEGMLIPPGYLEAPPPSSEVWAKYCVDKDHI